MPFMHPENGKAVILVAENEAVVRFVAQAVMTNAGYEVLTASDGAHALEISRSYAGTIHLLLSDVCMPKVQGPDLARTIAAERPGIRILLMTGSSGAMVRDSQSDLLQKPFRPVQLVERIAAILAKP